MEYRVMRLFADGVRVVKHTRLAASRRGKVRITQESIGQHRKGLVARLIVGTNGVSIPPLYDVTLMETSAECWMLAGFETLEAGPMRKPCSVRQVWLIEPAALQDLIDVEGKWTETQRVATALRAELDALKAGKPYTPTD